MHIHTLPSITKQSKRRFGQGHGSGRGKTAGRGTKGQNARGVMPIYFEGGALPLIKRLPILRGKDRFKSLQEKPFVINLNVLAKLPKKAVADLDTLMKHCIVPKDAISTGVKLLGNGEVDKAYTVKIQASKSAIKKIEKAGGTVESLK